jgi:hypothetical protein
VLDALDLVQPAQGDHDRAARGQAELAAQPSRGRGLEARRVDAVADDVHAPGVVAVFDEDVFHRLRVHHHRVRQPQHPALRPPLGGGPDVPLVADGGHGDGSRHLRHESGEQVGIEAVRVDDLDLPPAEVAQEADLPAQGLQVVQAGDRVVEQGQAALLDLGEKLAPLAQAGQVQLEQALVEPAAQGDELALRPTDAEVGDEFQEADAVRGHENSSNVAPTRPTGWARARVSSFPPRVPDTRATR